MSIDKMILVALTTSQNMEIKAPSFFRCTSETEMLNMANSLEGILDAVAHRLSEDIIVIVKHG